MMAHCAAIREAYKAILADWTVDALNAQDNESQLVHQTAVLASVQLNDTVSEASVRKILELGN